MAFGSYFAYDSVGAIETTLIKVFHADRSAIGAMYSVYSIAAVFAVLFGGYLIDRIGTRRASLLFSVLVVVGRCHRRCRAEPACCSTSAGSSLVWDRKR